MISIKNAKTVDEVRFLLSQKNKNVYYVGSKPWYDRPVTKFKFGLAVGVATGVISGAVAIGVMNSISYEESKTSNVSHGKITNIETPIKENPSPFKKALAIFKKDYPNLNLTNLNSKRDVARTFIGKNNFIALAAEMEGFRGDLHKDPGTGLNIGFGYNITKRTTNSDEQVIEDLLVIGIDREKINKIIAIAKKPQHTLSQAIEEFNNEYKLKNNQLISIQQGVALLKRTQNEYKKYAKLSFKDSFDKMAKHQQEVLTYVAYKAGYDTLRKYKKAITAADNIYSKEKKPSPQDLKNVAKELVFFYKKNGDKITFDQRATLIAHTFVSQDYLSVQIGKYDNLKHTPEQLLKYKINFENKKHSIKNDKKKPDLVDMLKKLRKDKDFNLEANEGKNKAKYS